MLTTMEILRRTRSIWLLLFLAVLLPSCAGTGSQRRYAAREIRLTFRFLLSFGSAGSGPGTFLNPLGIALDPLGNLYVADTGNDRVQKLDGNGRFLGQVGRFGRGEGQFSRPTDLFAGSGLELYVVDSRNRRIQVFDHQLNFMACLGPFAETEGRPMEFGFLGGLGVSPYGELYLTDEENDRIYKLTSSGRVETSFGRTGYEESELRRPLGVAVGRTNRIYVCDSGNGRVAQFDPFGEMLASLGEGILSGPVGIDLDGEGRIFVADTENHRVVVFDPSGQIVGELGRRGRGYGSFEAPGDLAVGARGSLLYVLDSGNNRVQKFEVGGL